MPFVKGQSGNKNGKPKGAENKTTVEFKDAVNKLLTYAAPKVVEWLDSVAKESPEKALTILEKYAEYVAPKQSRVEHSGVNGEAIEHDHTVRVIPNTDAWLREVIGSGTQTPPAKPVQE